MCISIQVRFTPWLITFTPWQMSARLSVPDNLSAKLRLRLISRLLKRLSLLIILFLITCLPN